MAIPNFYSPELSVALLESNKPILTLSESESGHAVRSRRLREGQSVNVLNGNGIIGFGKIVVINKRAVQIEFDSYDSSSQSKLKLSIATAIPKGDRQKVMIDMLTQLGVNEIIPLDCDYSVTRYSDNMKMKWQRASIESCKQSQNPWLPTITSNFSINELVEMSDSRVVYADAQGQSMASISLALHESNLSNLIVIIGPEGGLSEAEKTFLCGRNIQSVKLAQYILRTEAATVATAAQFSQNNW